MRRRGRNRTDDEGFGDLSDTISPRAHLKIYKPKITNSKLGYSISISDKAKKINPDLVEIDSKS